MTLFDIQHLTLTRSGKTVLQDVTLTIDEGETLVIIGPSGGGKSSLLRCLNRLEEPQPGQVFLQGDDITTLPVIELRRRVGMIFQKSTPFAGSVADNINYGPTLRGAALPRERIVALLQMASLEAVLIDTDARELSGGQEQRLAIARALALNPDVLLLDEPTSALDPIATHRVEQSILSLKGTMCHTMVWVSHSIEQARRVADRVLLLDAGRVMRIDSVDAMLDPATGDKRALAFAQGDEAALHDPNP